MDPIDVTAQTPDEGPRGIVTRGTAEHIMRRLDEAGFKVIKTEVFEAPAEFTPPSEPA